MLSRLPYNGISIGVHLLRTQDHDLIEYENSHSSPAGQSVFHSQKGHWRKIESDTVPGHGMPLMSEFFTVDHTVFRSS